MTITSEARGVAYRVATLIRLIHDPAGNGADVRAEDRLAGALADLVLLCRQLPSGDAPPQDRARLVEQVDHWHNMYQDGLAASMELASEVRRLNALIEAKGGDAPQEPGSIDIEANLRGLLAYERGRVRELQDALEASRPPGGADAGLREAIKGLAAALAKAADVGPAVSMGFVASQLRALLASEGATPPQPDPQHDEMSRRHDSMRERVQAELGTDDGFHLPAQEPRPGNVIDHMDISVKVAGVECARPVSGATVEVKREEPDVPEDNSEAIARGLGKAAAEHMTGPGYTIEPHDGAGGLAFTMTMDKPVVPSGVPDAPGWPKHPPPGWMASNSQNLRKPWTCAQIGDCTHTYETEQGAVDAAWEMATEDANGSWRTPDADAGTWEREYKRTEQELAELVDALGFLDEDHADYMKPTLERARTLAGLRKRVEAVLVECERDAQSNASYVDPYSRGLIAALRRVASLGRAALEVQS